MSKVYRKQMRGLHILSTICIHLAVVSRSAHTPTATRTNDIHVYNVSEIETSANHTHLQDLSVYYDLCNGTMLSPLSSASLSESVHSSERVESAKRRVGFRSNGCSCQELTCGCCTGISIQQFNFNREGCMNFTYDPSEFSLIMNMFMNNNPVYSNTVSAKNPPPFCLPFGTPYLPSVEFCARLFDVHTPGQNLQMCLDLETRVQHAPVLVLHFDCMRMGTSGLALVKPGEPLPPIADPAATSSSTSSSTTTEVAVTDIDIYDEVTEIKSERGTILI